jgi:predicted double-glycine peptidase
MRGGFATFIALLLAGHLGSTSASADDQATVITPTLAGQVKIKSWKELRDEALTKQNLDYSCGAASMSTILNGFYGKAVTEEEILKAMNKEDGMASFADMAAVLPRLWPQGGQGEFKGMGLALSFEQLQQLRIPAIVYLRYRGDDHFSVLRGISEDTVWLGDPSWGNRRFSTHQFLEMWETRDDADHKGKVLLILPALPPETYAHQTFFRLPEPNVLPIQLLGVRQF